MSVELKPIGVKITRAEKRGRKIIIVIESDLYSDETFAVNPFYDEGDEKNKLCEIRMAVDIKEQSGYVSAKVSFGNCLEHFTKGHTQLHRSIGSHYLTKKECAVDWFLNSSVDYYTEERANQIFRNWENDKEFYTELQKLYKKRCLEIKKSKLLEAQSNYKEALDKLNSCISDMTT